MKCQASLDVEVEYTWDLEEPATADYPGNPGGPLIGNVWIVATGQRILHGMVNNRTTALLEKACREDYAEEMQARKDGDTNARILTRKEKL